MPPQEPTFDFASVPWYPDSDSYEQFRFDAVDDDAFFSTFDEWLAAALEHERQAERHGVPIIRVRMVKSAFQQWCQMTGARNDASGRSDYAEYRACSIFQG